MTLKSTYYDFLKIPYYEIEIFLKKENKRIGTEYFKMNGQTFIQSKKFPQARFLIADALTPDNIGYKKRLKYYIGNAFPRVDPAQYHPAEDYEVITAKKVEHDIIDEKGNVIRTVLDEIFLIIDSRFFKKFGETKITGEIIAEPVNKWLEILNSPAVILLALAALAFVFFAVGLPNMMR